MFTKWLKMWSAVLLLALTHALETVDDLEEEIIEVLLDGSTNEVDGDRYIITFNSYLDLEEHLATLTLLLPSLLPWTHLPRNNPASHLPTDFLVIQLDDPNVWSLKDLEQNLQVDSRVKYVSPDSRLTRSSLASKSTKHSRDHPRGHGAARSMLPRRLRHTSTDHATHPNEPISILSHVTEPRDILTQLNVDINNAGLNHSLKTEATGERSLFEEYDDLDWHNLAIDPVTV